MGHKYRDWVDELVSLRIENQKLEDEIRSCHSSCLGYLRDLREVRQAPTASAPPPSTALARAGSGALERRGDSFFEEPEAHAPQRRGANIFGEDNTPARPKPQDHLSELVTLRLTNEALKERLRHERSFYQGIMAAAADEARYPPAAPPPPPAQRQPPQLPPAAPRLLGSKR